MQILSINAFICYREMAAEDILSLNENFFFYVCRFFVVQDAKHKKKFICILYYQISK